MAQKDYVDTAEELMKELAKVITTSKLRDTMAQVNELYNDIVLLQKETLSNKHAQAIKHLKVKMVYDAGRDRQDLRRWERKDYPNGKLTYFFEKTGLLDMVGNIGNSRQKFLEYCKYFEALVAYHKFYGGDD